MSFFTHEEPKHHSKPYRLLGSCLKDALSQYKRSSSLEEYSLSDTDDDDDQKVIVTVQARAMEAKLRRKSFTSILSPMAGELFISSQGMQRLDSIREQEDDEERETFFSAESYMSRCSSASREALFSAGSCLSRCSSSSKKVEQVWGGFRKGSILEELCHCEGWPFGLYRKALLLPPLPKSPSESWAWRKGTKMIKMP